jgi:hypothetical protein
MKSSFHSLIRCSPLFCNCQPNLIPLLPSSYPGRLASRNSTRLLLLKWTLLYNHVTRTTQKTQPLYFWVDVFTAPLHSNGCYSIVDRVFVATGMCLPSCCLAINVYSDFYILAFGRHVTIYCVYKWLVFFSFFMFVKNIFSPNASCTNLETNFGNET